MDYNDFESFTYESTAGGTRTSSLVSGRRLRDGRTIGFSYDDLGRLTQKDIPFGAYGEADISYFYDNLGRMTQASSANHAVQWVYDALGRQTIENSFFGAKQLEYDLAGRMTKLTHKDGVAFDYDHLVTGEVKSIRESGATSGPGVLATFSYDDLGRRLLLMRGNGTRTDYAHDPVSRLKTLGLSFPASPTRSATFDFTFNKASQIASRTSSTNDYAFTGVASGSIPSVVNGQNQLVNHNGVGFTYDPKGNLLNDGTRSYGYTSENRLAISGNVSLTYDPIGRLLVSDTGTSNTRFDHLGNEMILELNSANAIQRRFVHGPGVDEPLVQYEGSAIDTATRRFLHADERGSIGPPIPGGPGWRGAPSRLQQSSGHEGDWNL